jgi:release factor glutamine methyltransferase
MAACKPYPRKLAGLEYTVLPKVYKGSTDTELFCDVIKIKKGSHVWDIGTGTGLIALHAKKKGAEYVLATDLNPNAVSNARENSKALGQEIDVRQADVFGDIEKKFDVITFNPPFTDEKTQRPHEMSFWDKDHKTVKRFFEGVRSYLKPDGKAFIAWSSFGDIRKLKKIARSYDLRLAEAGKRKGKRGFTYYVFQIEA